MSEETVLRDRERWPDRKRVQRMARAELARLHGPEYRRLLAKYGRLLAGAAGHDEGGVRSGQCDV